MCLRSAPRQICSALNGVYALWGETHSNQKYRKMWVQRIGVLQKHIEGGLHYSRLPRTRRGTKLGRGDRQHLLTAPRGRGASRAVHLHDRIPVLGRAPGGRNCCYDNPRFREGSQLPQGRTAGKAKMQSPGLGFLVSPSSPLKALPSRPLLITSWRRRDMTNKSICRTTSVLCVQTVP